MVDNVTIINNVQGSSIFLSTSNNDFVLEENGVDWGSVESNHTTYKYTNQAGETVVNSTLQTRDISVTGWVVGKDISDLKSRKKYLNRLINPLQHMTIEYENYRLNFFPNASIKYGKDYKNNNDVFCKFVIEGFCSDPLFFDKEDTLVSAGLVNSKFSFPCHIPKVGGMIFGVREEYIILNIPNNGDIETGFTIVFEATKGSVTNPTLYNVVTQDYIKINKEMAKGERITINTFDGEKSIIGRLNSNSPEENYYKYKDINSKWLKVDVGDSLFKYDADSNVSNLSVRIYFKSRYLEVE